MQKAERTYFMVYEKAERRRIEEWLIPATLLPPFRL
jgi:hypothetical protein